MKVIKKYGMRRDCYVDLECERCGEKEIKRFVCNDRNTWDNIVPNWKCEKCGESTNSLGVKKEYMSTKYSADQVV